MPITTNALGQPIGDSLPGWITPPVPVPRVLKGRWCRVEPLDPERHAAELHAADSLEADAGSWTYLPYGPFPNFAEYAEWLKASAQGSDPRFYALIDAADGQAAGVASYLRILPASGSIEIGHLHYSPRLQRTTAATEAIFLLIQHAFGLGYRRCEWKCDALNEPSRRAAQRLGFSFEGVFRQATIYKGRSRDTAWYSILDREWPELERLFGRWLNPSNFDAQGSPRERLSELTGPRLAARG